MTAREYNTTREHLRNWLSDHNVYHQATDLEQAHIILAEMLIERLEALVEQIAASLVRLPTQVRESLADVDPRHRTLWPLRRRLSRDQARELLIQVGLTLEEAERLLDTDDETEARAIVRGAQARVQGVGIH
jgi:hypothetical protein